MYEIVSAAGLRRQIPDDYRYDAKKLKYLKHILHNVSVGLGTLTSALNEISRIKGPDISPDGLLGGVGYIISLKEIKQHLINSVHSLSDITDCIADELSNPKWNVGEDKEIKKLLKEKEEVDEKVEEEIGPSDVQDNQNPVEIAVMSSKRASIINSAVKKSLVNFVKNK